MRIAIIEITGEDGGMYPHLNGFGTALARENADVVIYTSQSRKSISEWCNDISVKYVFSNFSVSKSKVMKLIYLLMGAIKFTVLNIFLRPDVINLHVFSISWGLIFWKIFLYPYRRRLLVTVHDIDSMRGEHVASTEFKRSAISWVEWICVHNAHVASSLKHDLKIAPERIIDIPLGVPSSRGGGRKLTPSNVFTIGVFGHLKRSKGVFDAIKIFSALRQRGVIFSGIIAGGDLEGLSESLRSEIEWAGLSDVISFRPQFLDEQEFLSLMQSVDVVLLPYHRISQSGILVQAASNECAIVTSDLPGFRDVIGGVGCYGVAEDPSSFADILQGFAERPESLERYRMQVCSSVSARASWEQSAQKLIGFLSASEPCNNG